MSSPLVNTCDMKIRSDFNQEPYWNPYLAGIALGLVLLAAFVFMGRGLGASGAFSTMVAYGVHQAAPHHAVESTMYADYLDYGTNPLKDWIVFEMLGVLIGGFISGTLAHRVQGRIEKGPRIGNSKRLLFAFLGGALMAIGAKLARGCTSGQALTGGALVSLGSWAFMLSVFIGGYAFAYFMRRQWR